MEEERIDAKAVLRREVQQAVAGMAGEEKAIASEAAGRLLVRQRVWQEAHSILFFAPILQEVNIWPLLERALGEGRLVALPRFAPQTSSYTACRVQNLTEEINTGKFGIREPLARCPEVALNRLDLILVPGVAFDLHGRRLGRGKGFYDQLLAAVRGTTCGVAFEQQIVREVPVEPHDIHLNCILTPTRWIEL
jgi:5-formyltetrahydrofolate cyclo-ligase